MPPHQPTQSNQTAQILPQGFRVVDWLGTGQFGKVCKAQGQGGYECAFKIIAMSSGRAEGLKEFRNIRWIRRIKPHRNLVEYHGVWLLTSDGELLDNADQLEDADLTNLDVTELLIQMPLAVKSLEVRLKECKREFKKAKLTAGAFPGIPPSELLPYMRGVAEALDHLHSPIHPLTDRGLGWIMHRDIKPANLLIDRKGDVLVADYGVARAVGTNVKGTQTGAGTPIYTAPEQFTKKVEDFEASSDQYSLAITYYELRTGAYPFQEDVEIELNSLKRAHILGRLDFTKLPAAEQEVLKQATSRTISKRYSSCVVFIDELWKANGWTPMPAWMAAQQTPAPPKAVEPPSTTSSPSGVIPAKGTRIKAGSRTSIDLGTVPTTETPAELNEPPGTKPSGTLVHGAPRPLPSIPVSESPLPLAEPLEEADEPVTSPWHAPARKKSASRTPWYIAAGVLLAIGIGAAAYFISKHETPKVADNRPDPTPTSKDPIDPGPGPAPIQGTAPKVEPLIKPAPPPKPRFLEKERQAARDQFALGNIATGLWILLDIPEDAGKIGPEAAALAEAWTNASIHLKKESPTWDDCDEFERQSAPAAFANLPKVDAEPLRGIYAKLSEKNPSALTRVNRACESYKKRDFAAGRIELGRLLDMQVKEPLHKRVAALLKEWDEAAAFNEKFLIGIGKPVSLEFLETAIADFRKLKINESLETRDRRDLAEFYQTHLLNLVQRFAINPAGLNSDPEAWAALNAKLPTKEDGIDSPWLDLLRVESVFTTNALAASPKKTPIAALPKPDANDTPELAAYRSLVAAERSWHESSENQPKPRQAAAESLLAAIANEKVKTQFFTAARKRAFGQVLAQASRELKQPATAPDSPYAAEIASIELARRCLTEASRLLAGDKEKVDLLNEVRGRLLIAAAFPKPDPDATKIAAINSKNLEDVSKTLDASDHPNLWLAFARTRDLADAAGVREAHEGYQKLLPGTLADLGKKDADSTFAVKLAGFLREPALIKAFTADSKAAGKDLYLPLARQFHLLRKEKTLPIELLDKAAAISGSAEIEALAGLFAIESAGADVPAERLDLTRADRLVKNDKSATTLAHLGLVQFHNAKKEKEKLELLQNGGANLLEAIKLTKSAGDPDKLLGLLHHAGALDHLQLGQILEANRKRSDAIKAFTLVLDLSKDRDALIATSQTARLARGRCHYNAVLSKADEHLAAAREDLKLVEKRDADEFVEAAYWLAVIDLYANDLLDQTGKVEIGPETHYESGKRQLVGSVEIDSDWTTLGANPQEIKSLDAVNRAFDKPPAGKSPYALELLEWRACLACARASADKTFRKEAFDALKDLEKLDPLTAAYRRTQFLVYRLQVAQFKKTDPGLDAASFADLWKPAAERIKELQGLATLPRLPGSPNTRDRMLFDLFMLHAKAQSLAIPEIARKADFTESLAWLDAMLAMVALKQERLPEAVGLLEELGYFAYKATNAYRTEKSTALEVEAAAFAVQVFARSGRADPSLKQIVGFHTLQRKGVLLYPASHRDYVARRISYDLSIAMESLAATPDKLHEYIQANADQLIVLDSLVVQGTEILRQKETLGPQENNVLERLRVARESMLDGKFETHFNGAIEAMLKKDNSDKARAKAAEWRQWWATRSKAIEAAKPKSKP